MKTVGRKAALALACVAAACGKAKAPDAARPMAARAAPVRRFAPPADGLLTEAQINRFLLVRHAARGRSEADAARALGVDPDEHAWVRARVLEAAAVLDERRIRAASAETYARTLAQLHQTRAAVSDPVTSATLDEQIASLERERAAWKKPDPLTPAVAANAKRVERRLAEIETASP